MRLQILPQLLALIPVVTAHGRITNITTSAGTVYPGWDPEFPKPNLAAWSASNLGNIFVPPSNFNTSNITCHFNSSPGLSSVPVTAGDTIKLQWNEWPFSHKGPVLDYLASCNGDCKNADKEKLQWVKIAQLGWLNSSGLEVLGGTWANDVLIGNGFSWNVKIPTTLKEGDYVLRHEIIALHVAEDLNGAQAYPQCVNIRVARNRNVKSGAVRRIEGGVLGHRLYGERDAGIFLDIHRKISGYPIPGPGLWSGAEKIKQPSEG
ncbi:glycoside hydrolase [Dendryphion nanum]|uniref:Glycoside hydrolase n=1 Tax=Dendryphion nanum TaxID=256645 RepID=A0A9P9IU50_9PLEO|nr:glycoside hydrolase [Dendryphion nanum]